MLHCALSLPACATHRASRLRFERGSSHKRVLTAEDFALIATDDASVTAECIRVAEAAEPPVVFANAMEKIAVKKLYKSCTAAAAAAAAGGSAAVAPLNPDKAEIPPQMIADLRAVWVDRHDFVIPDNWLLIPMLQGKLWRGLATDPPTIDILLVEQLRPMSCSDRRVGTQLALIPGHAVMPEHVVVDSVSKTFDFYIRARAWFCTMAYVSVRRAGWLTYQHAIYGSERILHYMQLTYNGRSPPVSYFISAWASTIQCFAEAVRINDTSLSSLVLNAGMWANKWTHWSPNLERASSSIDARPPANGLICPHVAANL